MPSLELVVTEPAQEDILRAIGYTQAMWGEAQRNRFAADLNSTLDHIHQYPDVGKARPGLGRGVRTFPAHHYIFVHKRTSTKVFILRVIHYRRDLKRSMIPVVENE